MGREWLVIWINLNMISFFFQNRQVRSVHKAAALQSDALFVVSIIADTVLSRKYKPHVVYAPPVL